MRWFSDFLQCSSCWLCDNPLALPKTGICSFCWPIEWLLEMSPQAYCQRCGLPSAQLPPNCGRCLRKPPPWDSLLAVSAYTPPLSGLINQYKFQQRFELAPTLARLLLLRWLATRHSLLSEKPDLLLPVPLHRWRRWRRGFNQSALITAYLSRWLAIEWQDNLLLRCRATVPQQQLPAAARRRNLTQAFTLAEGVSKSLEGKRVALIDDVVTTGTTVTVLSQLLRRAGVREIQIWTLCRTNLC
ncbi:MAG: phosphoribosyltransferase family protein [Candidatus Symbiodolus clandestinus]